jgi:hypothetical protein
LKSKLERLETDPASMFLPLGTVVRFIDVSEVPNNLAILPIGGTKQYPLHGSIGDKQETEMVLEADGLFWRLHDFGGTQSVECLRSCKSLSEMPWITGPIEPPSRLEAALQVKTLDGPSPG